MKTLAAGLLIFTLVQAAPVSADTTVALRDRRTIETCLAERTDAAARAACIGRVSKPCLDGDGGQSTVGMVECYAEERGVWEHLLEEYAAQLRSRESATQREQLDRALQAGQEWALARCAYDASIYEGGSLARVVAAGCMTETIAHRAIDLRNRLDEYASH